MPIFAVFITLVEIYSPHSSRFFKLLVPPADEPVEGQGLGSLVVQSKSGS